MARWKLVTVLATNRLGAVERVCLYQERDDALEAAAPTGVGDVGRERGGVQAGIRSSQPPRRPGARRKSLCGSIDAPP
jgi:hypothetical protein